MSEILSKVPPPFPPYPPPFPPRHFDDFDFDFVDVDVDFDVDVFDDKECVANQEILDKFVQ